MVCVKGEGASKQSSDPKNSYTPRPYPPGFEIPGSATVSNNND